MDGRIVNACMIMAWDAVGHEITTVEGLMDGEQLGPVQKAFAEHDAFQCGYCTPGQIMAAEGLLRANPAPGRDEVLVAIKAAGTKLFWAIIGQIAIIDIVFSLDSVITAVGMVDNIAVMASAVIASVGVMLVAAKPIGEFVDRHPSVKVLALAFLVMVGMALTAEAFDQHVPKGYIYAAMAFSLGVEALNIRARTKRARLAAEAAKLAQVTDEKPAA